MASDSSRAHQYGFRSAELRNDLGGEELQVVEVGHVEKLQVSPLYAGRDIWAELVRVSAGVPTNAELLRSSSTSRPIAAARRAVSASCAPQTTNAAE
jgi:hypothetical protein